MFQQTQLTRAVNRENFEDAARLKVAIAAATTNDTVGRVMTHLKVRDVFGVFGYYNIKFCPTSISYLRLHAKF